MSQYPTGNLEVNNDHKRVRSHDIDPWQPTGLLSGKLVLWTGWVDSVSTLTLARLSILPRCHCKHGSPPRSKLYPENIWGRGGFSVCSMQNWWQVGGPIVSTLAWDAQLIYDNNELVYFSLPHPRKINIAPEKKSFEDWRLLSSCVASLTSSKCGFHGMFVQIWCYSLPGAAVPPYCVPLFSISDLCGLKAFKLLDISTKHPIYQVILLKQKIHLDFKSKSIDEQLESCTNSMWFLTIPVGFPCIFYQAWQLLKADLSATTASKPLCQERPGLTPRVAMKR